MADLTTNYKLSALKIRAEIAELEMREHKHRFGLMELVERRTGILANWEAEKVAIAAKRETLAELAKAHGEFSKRDLASAETQQLDGLEEDQ